MKIRHCIEHKSCILYNDLLKIAPPSKAGSYSAKEKKKKKTNELSCVPLCCFHDNRLQLASRVHRSFRFWEFAPFERQLSF